jgi:phasin
MTAIEVAKKPAKAGTMPKFDMPKLDVPEAFREFAEKGVAQAKDAYARMKSAAEETTDLIEDTYATATKGVTEFNLKTLEALRANMNAGFDYAREMAGARTLADAVELSAVHMRKQFDALSAQTKELSAIAQKIATETAEPIKAGVSKSFKLD